ncbi:MAG: hypothetical protein IJ071_02375 [Ruminococcus sp.]|nr:hypothetical protein [Ruminococcus sp.]
MRIYRSLAAAAALVFTAGAALAAPLSAFPVTAAAEESTIVETDDGLTFAVYSDHAEVTKCTANYVPVEVPEEVSGVPVTALAEGAFSYSNASSIVLPEAVSSIAKNAVVAGTVREITFGDPNCVFPDGPEAIYTDIEEIPSTGEQICRYNGTIIGASGSTAESYAERYGYSFKAIGAEEEPYTEVTEDIFTFYVFSDRAELAKIAFKTDNLNGSAEIPDQVEGLPVTAVRSNAAGGSGLAEITVPATVERIDRDAFGPSPSLTKLTLLSPDHQIYDSGSTICRSKVGSKGSLVWNSTYEGVIQGYSGSTAQKYAERYGYSFEVIYSLGDVDGDGRIDSSDASAVLVEYAAVQTGSAPTVDKSFGDVNGDGFIDSSDASDILQYYSFTQTGGTDSISEFLGQ